MPALVSIVLLAIAVVWLTQRWLIYFPDREPPPLGRVGLLNTEAVAFITEDDVRLEGWFLRPIVPPTGRTVIVFNGNAGNRAARAVIGASFAARGFACLLFDYRGYGGNPGLPSERGLIRDARAALAAVLSRDDVDPQRIIYFGESLGAAVAVQLAVEHPPEALILRSPFTSIREMAQVHVPILPFAWLLRDRYPSIDLIAHVGAPVLIVAGSDDRIVPIDQSERLHEAASEPKRFVTVAGADHNDEPLTEGVPLFSAVMAFLDK